MRWRPPLTCLLPDSPIPMRDAGRRRMQAHTRAARLNSVLAAWPQVSERSCQGKPLIHLIRLQSVPHIRHI
jgi:hypothetical protein